MIHFFKNKNTIKRESFNAGYKKAKSITEKLWQYRLNEMQSKAKKIIQIKNREIKKRDDRLAKIEKELENFVQIISDARFMAIQVAEEEYIKHQQLSDEYKKIQMQTDYISSLYRRSISRSKNLVKQIDEYKIDTLQ